jgi:hypothetical protein
LQFEAGPGKSYRKTLLKNKVDVVVHTCRATTWEVEGEKFLSEASPGKVKGRQYLENRLKTEG